MTYFKHTEGHIKQIAQLFHWSNPSFWRIIRNASFHLILRHTAASATRRTWQSSWYVVGKVVSVFVVLVFFLDYTLNELMTTIQTFVDLQVSTRGRSISIGSRWCRDFAWWTDQDCSQLGTGHSWVQEAMDQDSFQNWQAGAPWQGQEHAQVCKSSDTDISCQCLYRCDHDRCCLRSSCWDLEGERWIQIVRLSWTLLKH